MAFLFEIPVRRCFSIVFSPFYLLLSVIAVVTALAMREVRHWAWYLFLSLNLLLVYENLMLMQYGESTNWAPAYLFSVLLLFLLSYRVSRELLVPWVIPRVRWWESDPRYKTQISAELIRKEGEEPSLACHIVDLDYGGCFIRTRALFERDERVQVRFQVFGLDITCPGFVVLKVESAVTHPAGIGVKFAPHSRLMRRRMKRVHDRIRAINRLYQTGRYLLNTEEYFRTLRELQDSPIQDPLRLQKKA